MLALGRSRSGQLGADCTHRPRLSREPRGECRTEISAKVTCVRYWASRRALTSSCLRSDLSLWNMHKRGYFGGGFGGSPRPPIGSDSHESLIPCLVSSRM